MGAFRYNTESTILKIEMLGSYMTRQIEPRLCFLEFVEQEIWMKWYYMEKKILPIDDYIIN